MRTAGAVMAAGALGAAVRYAVGLALQPAHAGAFPWGTLAANLLGCLLLGLLAGGADRLKLPAVWREAAGAGFIGSFTTFSAFSMETVGLLDAGRTGLAAVYVLLSMAAGYALAWAGLATGRRLQGAGAS